MEKPVVAVVFGSRSTEHDISILTAIASVIKPLELSQKYTVLPVYIAKNGSWYMGERFKDIALYQSGNLDETLSQCNPVSIHIQKGLNLIEQSRFTRTTQKIDIVFPALHGSHGEDGELMALCQLADVPFVGCDMEASVIAMDKVLAKQVAEAEGIATAPFVAFSKHAYETAPHTWETTINARLHYPVFVKPAHLGSSIGISRVASPKDLPNAIEVALHYDDKALVEEAVPNLCEVTLPVLGNARPRPASLEEPLIKSEDFFDFDTKYLHGGKGKGKGTKGGKQGAQGYSRIPADLPKKLYTKAEAVGLAVYQALGCQGMARVDMLIDTKSGHVYFNEVNPLPGSLYAHNWARSGLSNIDLVVTLIELAQERFNTQQSRVTSFSTNYLQQF